MRTYDPNDGSNRRRRSDRYTDPIQAEPSMSAPSPMPGKPAASYAKPPQAAAQSQTGWQSTPYQDERQAAANQYRPPAQGWKGQYPAQQGYPAQQSYPAPQGYPVQQGYQSAPSQGVPGGQTPPQQYGAWQQGYTPAPVQQGYQQPTGRGWSQPSQNQGQSSNAWQGGYAVSQWNGNGYTPVYEEPSNRGGHGGGGTGGKHPKDRKTLIKLIAAAAVIVFAVALVVNLIVRQQQTAALYASVNAYNDKYCQGVYVDGIHLGGMTREEAYAAVQQSAQLKCDEWNVQLMTPEGAYLGEINSYHLGMTVHVDDTLEDAWRQGHTGATVSERKAAMDALLTTPYEGSTALPSGDTAKIDQILNEIAANVYTAPVDAQCVFDASVNLGSPFKITDEVVGQYLDVASIKAQVYDMVSRMESGVIQIEPTPLYPTLTRAYWEERTQLIGSAYTKISTTSTETRDANIARASELINGTIIQPGEVFSFNNVVGKRTKENGFYLATVYAYGKEEEGYGGGVCQVSSTMYWAAIRANLEIVKREQHALKVGYTELGFDATVNYDGRKIDFSFRNSTSNPIYIITKVMLKPNVDRSRYLVMCDIYGEAPETGVTYDIVAVQTEIPMPSPTVVPDKKAEYVTYTDETYTVQGSVGTQVDSYKVKYVNGEEVERTHLYTDIYKAVEPVTYVGVSERPLDVEDPWY